LIKLLFNPIASGHFLCSLPAGKSGKFLLFHEDQGASGARFHAGRYIPARTTVTFEGNPPFPFPPDHPVGADHGAHPASNALIRVVGYNAGSGVLDESTCATGPDTRGILTVPAKERHLASEHIFHIEAAAGAWGFGYGRKEVLGTGMLYSTGQLT